MSSNSSPTLSSRFREQGRVEEGGFLLQEVKNGYPIGIATEDIKKGELVHTHNLKTGLGEILEYTYTPEICHMEAISEDFFMGFEREDGRVGIRNEIWVLPTVGCISKIAEEIANKAKTFYDDVFAFPHPFGCSQLGEDHLNTQKVIAGLAKHPNTAGVLVLGLGCENNRIEELKKVTVKQLANGEVLARNEKNNYREIAIFKTGVTL